MFNYHDIYFSFCLSSWMGPHKSRAAFILRGVSVCEKKYEKVWNAWKDVLFNAFKVWQWGFVKSKKVWNQIKIWTLTSLYTPADSYWTQFLLLNVGECAEGDELLKRVLIINISYLLGECLGPAAGVVGWKAARWVGGRVDAWREWPR